MYSHSSREGETFDVHQCQHILHCGGTVVPSQDSGSLLGAASESLYKDANLT